MKKSKKVASKPKKGIAQWKAAAQSPEVILGALLGFALPKVWEVSVALFTFLAGPPAQAAPVPKPQVLEIHVVMQSQK